VGVERLSEEAEGFFLSAQRVARRRGHGAVTAGHVLLGALEPVGDELGAALAAARIQIVDLRAALERTIAGAPAGPAGGGASAGAGELALGEDLTAALRAAGGVAAGRGDDCVRAPDLLVALLGSEALAAPLRQAGIDGAALVRGLAARQARGEDDADGGGAGETLARHTIDLTARARAGKLDPVIGREPEIRQVIQVLSRRLKNNPLLVGEPGVGKTAVIEGLAQRIAAGRVPEALQDHRVLSLDLGSLLAGTRYRGQFEERLKGLLAELRDAGNAILFIDEIHGVIGAGGAEGGTDAANLLKPALSRGELRCIGATTVAEHRKRIEKDAALSRRFQVITVDEPSAEEALTVLRGLRPTFEAHHGVRIADAALHAAVQLSTRHLGERFLPDKAIDLVDQAAATLRTALASRPEALEARHDALARLELEAEALEADDDGATRARAAELRTRAGELRARLQQDSAAWLREREVINETQRLRRALDDARRKMKEAVRDRRYAEVAELQYEAIPALEARLGSDARPAPAAAAASAAPTPASASGAPAPAPAPAPATDAPAAAAAAASLRPVVTEADIAKVVARTTGIPAERLTRDEGQRLLELARTLAARVIGQPEPVERVARAVRRARAGLGDPRRPLASFLLVGPTGVGKTELCKALAEFLFSDERALIRLDMSEYMEKHAAARLVGAPPGYIGFDEGGELTNQIRRRPYSVVLLDEVEKAHPDVFNLLLQVLDEGHLTDSSGRRVDFKNTVIMLTSNLGSGGGRGQPDAARREAIMRAVKGHFRPELLNRLDDVLMFSALDRDAVVPIVRLQLGALERQLAQRQVRLQISDAAVAKLADDGYDPEYGARPLKRLIQTAVADPLADAVLRGALPDGATAAVDLDAASAALVVHTG
jgi:ATP-dependent Clp protease ATP-binding subunit ClpB